MIMEAVESAVERGVERLNINILSIALYVFRRS
jgi:hypothetical protein